MAGQPSTNKSSVVLLDFLPTPYKLNTLRNPLCIY